MSSQVSSIAASVAAPPATLPPSSTYHIHPPAYRLQRRTKALVQTNSVSAVACFETCGPVVQLFHGRSRTLTGLPLPFFHRLLVNCPRQMRIITLTWVGQVHPLCEKTPVQWDDSAMMLRNFFQPTAK